MEEQENLIPLVPENVLNPDTLSDIQLAVEEHRMLTGRAPKKISINRQLMKGEAETLCGIPVEMIIDDMVMWEVV